MQVLNFGASIFPTTAAADFISSVTTALSDNLGVVLAVFGFTFGISFVLRMFNRSTQGRL